MPINTILFETHSGLRWLVVLAFILVAAKYTIGLIQGGGFDSLASNLMLAFTILVTVQWVIGLIYAFYYWATIRFAGDHIPHLLIMTAAVGLVHMIRGRYGKDVTDAPTAYRNGLLGVLGIAAIIFVGVIVLPGGITRWAM